MPARHGRVEKYAAIAGQSGRLRAEPPSPEQVLAYDLFCGAYLRGSTTTSETFILGGTRGHEPSPASTPASLPASFCGQLKYGSFWHVNAPRVHVQTYS
jgi:hypothetical protein